MKAFYVAFFVVFSFLSCAPSSAQTLRIGVGLSKPPYVIKETESGMELDILRRTLQIAGYGFKPVYLPLKRILYGLNNGELDGGITLRPHIPIEGYYSEKSMITYQNFAISLTENDLTVKSMNDLSDLSVVAFHNAHKNLGKEFANAVVDNKNYREIANQELQVKMLLAGRVDVVVSDFKIFLHFKKTLEKDQDEKTEITFHPLFTPTQYHAGFRKKIVRDRFDQAFESLKKSGEYDKIVAKYISPNDYNQFMKNISQ